MAVVFKGHHPEALPREARGHGGRVTRALTRHLALGALVAAAVAVAVATAGPAWHWWRIEHAIAALGDPAYPVPEAVGPALAELDDEPPARIAGHRRALFAALARRSDAILADRDSAEAAASTLARLARLDPALLAEARAGPETEPFAFRALLAIGRPDLADPAPRETTLEACEPWKRNAVALGWGGLTAPAVDRPYDLSAWNGDGSTTYVNVVPDDGGLADLGAVPLEAAAAPPPGDPRWVAAGLYPVSDGPTRRNPQLVAVAVAAGHTYVLRMAERGLVMVAAFEVLELRPDFTLRLRWRVLSSGSPGASGQPGR